MRPVPVVSAFFACVLVIIFTGHPVDYEQLLNKFMFFGVLAALITYCLKGNEL